MKLTPPTKNTLYLSVFIIGLGMLGVFVPIPFVSDNPYWFMGAGYGVLFLGVVLENF